MKVTLKSTNLQDRTAVECELEMAGYEHAEIASLWANKAQLKEVIEGLDAAMNLPHEELEKQLGLDGGKK